MASQMKREYAAVPKGGRLPRSSFNLSRRHLTTHHGGWLVPIFWGWLFPGDVIKASYQAFVRASSPLEFPLFDNLKLTIHTYFVPIRILWTNARKFFGEQDDPGDSIAYTLPTLGGSTNYDTSLSGMDQNLLRYLGVPVQTAAQGGVDLTDIGAIAPRAYNSIYNWHYRDQQQQNSLPMNLGDGPDTTVSTDYQVRFRGKRHDRFTSLLAAPQKGDAVPYQMDVRADLGGGQQPTVYSTSLTDYQHIDANATLADISATAGTQAEALHVDLLINDLRNTAAIQQFLERDNRYGTRYDELIYAHYGVEFNDIRIAPVFLGGGSGYISTSAIPNQSGTGTLGDLAAIATGVLDGAGFTYAVDEPGIYMAIANVSGDLSYSQGLEKKHSYQTRYEMFFPEFTRIGDQAVEMKELFYQNDANDETVMGYEPRYEELRTEVNRISGEFDPNDASTLEVMHLQEDLGSQPVLGDTWIKDSTPYSRMLRVTTQHHFLADYKMNCRVARALPTYGVPGIGRL